jgi:hypothetical protein
MLKRWWGGVVAMVLVACGLAPQAPAPSSAPVLGGPMEAVLATATVAPEVTLQNFGPAPELNNEVWLNVSQPLRLSDLRGQVVLLDMWTFG